MKKHKYRPVLFFVLAYLFTWMFWIPAIFVPENIGIIIMLIGMTGIYIGKIFDKTKDRPLYIIRDKINLE